jgi:hypothetical protein
MVPLFLHHVLMQILSPFFGHFPIVHVIGEVQGIPSINAYCNHHFGQIATFSPFQDYFSSLVALQIKYFHYNIQMTCDFFATIMCPYEPLLP